MEVTDQIVGGVIGQLQHSVSQDENARTQAVAQLLEFQRVPNYLVVLMKIMSMEEVPIQVRQSAAVQFKNTIKAYWDNEKLASPVIGDPDRAVVKQNMVNLMLGTPRLVQTQVAAALTLVARVDFPREWPSLTPELVDKMQSPDYGLINGALEVCVSLFERYRWEQRSDELWLEIKHVLDTMAPALLSLFKQCITHLEEQQNNPDAVRVICTAISHIAEIFFLLNVQDIPQFFEDSMDEWMRPFQALLEYNNPSLESGDKDVPGVLEKTKASICKSVELYANRYEDEFKAYIQQFVQQVWTLLTTLTEDGRHDALCTTAMSCITSIVKKPWNKAMFSNPEALASICEKVIIPQVKLRDSDTDMFQYDGLEYVRRDMEGSDVDTRRRTTVEFVRGLCVHFEAEITEILKGYVSNLLSQYQSNPQQNWPLKDAAMYIVLAISVQGATSSKGATQINPYIDVGEFFVQQVVTELQKSASETHPVLKADCLKFVSVFRQHLPQESLLQVLSLLVNNLNHESFVVHSYAAIAMDKILNVRESDNSLRISPDALVPNLGPLFEALFAVFNLSESQENEYAMKAILRVCAVAKERVLPHITMVLERLATILGEVSKRPRNPQFNHFLFETVACCVHNICSKSPESVQSFQDALFPVFNTMLGMESCREFAHYAYQIMAQLLRFNASIPPVYEQLFPSLLEANRWENHGDIPALVSLLKAYLQKGGNIVTQSIEPMLGIFQLLLSIRRVDHFGTDLFIHIINYCPPEVYQNHLTSLFSVCFQRLTAAKTQKVMKNLIIMWSHLIFKLGAQIMFDVCEAVKPGILLIVLQNVWLENANLVSDSDDRHLVAIASTRLLVSDFMAQQPYRGAWGPLLKVIIELFEADEAETKDEVDPLERAETGLNTAFARLAYAFDDDVDPLQNVNGKQVFMENLAQFMNQHPGQYTSDLQQIGSPHDKTLQEYCQTFGVALV